MCSDAEGRPSEFTSSVVINDGDSIEHPSLGPADGCFKASYTFDQGYPKLCVEAWKFIHVVIFAARESNAIKPMRVSSSNVSMIKCVWVI